MTEENPKEAEKTAMTLKCDRCETTEMAREYDPRTPGYPHKRVNLCDKCGERDPKAVLIADQQGGIAPVIATPKNAPERNEIETIKFPQTPVAVVDNPKSKRPKASENKAKDVETKPIDRVDIEKKIEEQEKDLDTLLRKRQTFQQNINQLSDMIMAKRGAVAQMRELLGE
jgi:hypothetical protein